MSNTLGAIPTNQKDILKRDGKYKQASKRRSHRKPNAIPGGGKMPLDRKKHKKELAMSNSSQSKLNAIMNGGSKDFGTEGNASEQTGTSIFDPVLCELAYRWFCPDRGKILDPFAGGSVRGIVGCYLGYEYTGIELRNEQVEANRTQAKEILSGDMPNWIVGDSKNIDKLAPGKYDFLFSCPPYYDLELYSEDEKDLSNCSTYIEFLKAYRYIISESVSKLSENRFAMFVVGGLRDKEGIYRNFPSDTITAFIDSGMKLYNEAILVTAIGSLPIRIGRQFSKNRKLGKTHQNVLIFYKGNPKEISNNFREEIEVEEIGAIE